MEREHPPMGLHSLSRSIIQVVLVLGRDHLKLVSPHQALAAATTRFLAFTLLLVGTFLLLLLLPSLLSTLACTENKIIVLATADALLESDGATMLVTLPVGGVELKRTHDEEVGLRCLGKGTGQDGRCEERTACAEVLKRPEGVRGDGAEGDKDGSRGGGRGRCKLEGSGNESVIVIRDDVFDRNIIVVVVVRVLGTNALLAVRGGGLVGSGSLALGGLGLCATRVGGRRCSDAEKRANGAEEVEDERLVRTDVAVLIGDALSCRGKNAKYNQ